MATIQYARLYPDTTQLQAKDGHNLTAGWVEVYLAGTDDPAITYADFNGTRNPQKIPVDDNGRFCAIVDKSKAYRVEVYDADGALQWTTEPVWCTGNAGAGISVTKVISTDGSIAVEEQIDGSERTYDLSLAPPDNDEYLEWIKCSEEDCGSTWRPVYQAGTMETEAGQGIKVHGGHLYHFTSTFYVDPDGTGIFYDTFKVTMYCNDEIVDVRDFDIDSSLNDSVQCEFSTDVIPPEDGVVYYKLNIPITCEVTAEVQCHRIYSGINAVPDSCAAKPWVSEYFEEKSSMSAYIPYSGLDYNQGGAITGISGSAIYASIDSGTVSAIASSYAESAISSISGWSGDFSSISSKIDWSSSGVFQPSGNYQTAGDYAYNSSLSSKVDQSAFEQCCDEVHSAIDEKLDKSASSEFQPSGDYVYESAYSSFSSEVTNNISSISSTVSGLTGQYIEQSASSMFQPSGNYASASDLSSYVPFSGIEGEGGHVTGISGSSIKGHEYTGLNPVIVDNTADTIAVEHRTLCVDSTMTAYTSGDSAVIGVNVAGLDISSKMDASASSLFYSTSNPSGFITGVDLSPYQLTADMSAYAHESSLSAKLDTSASSDFYGTANPSGFIDGASASAIASAYQVVSATATQLYAGTAYLISVNGTPISAVRAGNASNASLANSAWYDGTGRMISALPDEATVSSIASSYAESAASGKLDESATADFYSTSNPSGFITGVDLSDYATTAYVDSSVSSFVDSAYVESQVSSKQDTLSFGYDDDKISAINGSALAGQGGGGMITAIGTSESGITSLNNSGIIDTAALHSADYSSLYVQEPLYISSTGDSSYIGISGNIDSATCSAIASAYAESAASGKLDTTSQVVTSTASASSVDFGYTSYYMGGINGLNLSANKAVSATHADQANEALSATNWLGESSKLDSSASSSFYTTANESGFIDSAYVDNAISSKADESALSGYYTTANESGYVDSAYVEEQVSGKQDASAMTAYQEVSGMSAYQPSGAYIYESALGWAEV